jgi:hypothetical protein
MGEEIIGLPGGRTSEAERAWHETVMLGPGLVRYLSVTANVADFAAIQQVEPFAFEVP